jgi:hypothetical protein
MSESAAESQCSGYAQQDICVSAFSKTLVGLSRTVALFACTASVAYAGPFGGDVLLLIALYFGALFMLPFFVSSGVLKLLGVHPLKAFLFLLVVMVTAIYLMTDVGNDRAATLIGRIFICTVLLIPSTMSGWWLAGLGQRFVRRFSSSNSRYIGK